jgi:hypothetical protein
MSALLWYRDQAFSVSNSAKDLLYEVAVEVAHRGNPATHQRLIEDGRLVGCYGVSGMGFELEVFEEAFEGKEAWQEAMARHSDAVQALYPSPPCARLMAKLFAWIWFLLDGGRCSDAAGGYPDLEELPEIPGAEVLSRSNAPGEDRRRERALDSAEPGLAFKFFFGITLGALVGTGVGVANILLGLANNWLTIPAWTISGALLGSAHPMADAVLQAIIRLFDR